MPRIAVVGAGISGLCTAHYLVREFSRAGRGAEIVIFEADRVPGGKMRTIREQGFAMEWGPNGFLTNKPHALDLVRELGIEHRLAPSSDLARKRFILFGGRLRRLPETPPAFLRSDLLTLRGKLRVLLEPLARPAPRATDESLADFARRRLGAEALERLIDPMATGIFAGDPERMSLASCFPVIAELERRHGGLVKGMLALRRERRRAGAAPALSAGPGGVLTSFDEGVEALVRTLAERLAEGLHVGVAVERVSAAPKGYLLSLSEKGRRETMEADAVVVAAESFAAAPMLEALEPALAEALSSIPYAPVAVVALGYHAATLGHPLDGFGFLVPRSEGRRILGALWDSSVFPNRAPEGKALIRAMVGGARAPGLAALPEADLVALVREELRAAMGISAAPVIARVFRHPRGIPQYLVGHAKVLAAIDAILASRPGLYLNSNAYRGVALNDCVRQSQATAERIVAELPP